ncbi:hypothetical protein B0H11DRAFT_2243283 [Mycena galericulata]|nr:hypothetical protein B0H11DRAFT_2243283 [Mycena galericulata]
MLFLVGDHISRYWTLGGQRKFGPIPKLHLFSHHAQCQWPANHHVFPFGQTDGEAIERPTSPNRGEFQIALDRKLLESIEMARKNGMPDESDTGEDSDDEMPALMSEDEMACAEAGRVRGRKPRDLSKL